MSVQSSSSEKSWITYVGWAVSALPVLALVASATMKFNQGPDMADKMAHLGYDPSVWLPLGIIELACTALYVIPRTKFLGAVLLTAYLGGATATHVRVTESFAAPVVLGILLWLGLALRDKQARDLLPARPAARQA